MAEEAELRIDLLHNTSTPSPFRPNDYGYNQSWINYAVILEI